MYEYTASRLWRLLHGADRTGQCQQVSDSRSNSWGIGTWSIAIGIAASVLGFVVDQRLVPVGLFLFVIGLVVVVAGSFVDIHKNR